MNTKDAQKFIERKFDNKIIDLKKEYDKKINLEKQIVDDDLGKLKSKTKKALIEALLEKGFTEIKEENITLEFCYRCTSKFDRYQNTDIERFKKECFEKTASLNYERETLLDEIMIIGVKDPEIREKLKKLL